MAKNIEILSDLLIIYEFKRSVGNPNFSDRFKKIIKGYIKKKLDKTWLSCDSLHAWL